MKSTTFEVATEGRRVTDLTARAVAFARDAGSDGLLHVFAPHATAGLALIETGAGSDVDIEELLERTFPRDDRYTHRHGSVGHGGDHLLPAFISPSLVLPVIDGAIALGTWQSIVLVDPNRENNVRAGFSIPIRPSAKLAWDVMTHPAWSLGTFARTVVQHGIPHVENMDATRGPPMISRNLERALGNRDQLTWEHVKLIRRRWKGRLVIKGILSAADARAAKEHGVDGIMVSNHGGRQLDGAVAPLRVLPQIMEAARGMTVILDGGIRRGTDVLKALALGADFVFVGRPFLYAAAVGG